MGDHGGMDLLEGIATTRAIRRYRPDPIPEDDLASILWHASRAPSGSNRQPTRFLALREGPGAVAAKAVLGRAFRRGWGGKRTDHGFDRGSAEDPASPKARSARAMQRFVDRFEETPVVVLACIERWRAPHISEGGSVFPACQNLLLAARALGYGGVLSMWHAYAEDELRAVLDIPEQVVIAATIALGVPEGHHGPVRRLPLDQVVYDDRWGGAAGWAVDPPGTRFTRAGPRTESR
jgi:nitroreductase